MRPSDAMLLAQFKQYVQRAPFMRLDRMRRRKKSGGIPLKKANGVIRPTSAGKVHYLFAEAFKAWFPSLNERKRLTVFLRSRRIFLGKASRRTGQGSCHDESRRFILAARER
jgi:hypothetical protein